MDTTTMLCALIIDLHKKGFINIREVVDYADVLSVEYQGCTIREVLIRATNEGDGKNESRCN